MLVTSDIYRILENLLISELSIWDIKVDVDDDIMVEANFAIWDTKVKFYDEINNYIKVNRKTNKANRNTGPPPTMVVVSRRVMN